MPHANSTRINTTGQKQMQHIDSMNHLHQRRHRNSIPPWVKRAPSFPYEDSLTSRSPSIFRASFRSSSQPDSCSASISGSSGSRIRPVEAKWFFYQILGVMLRVVT
ncbi:type II and III secretion system protein [Striga asiatica]|uniref:Type II and III secretion system protein n=1 Tax=Striga asiatica TaxID=4170 RepID=A0A5A7QPV7_STRAF|nr:type II and III secretion system protein [Striga asiatica]